MCKKGSIAARLLSVILSAAMTVTMLPTSAMSVYASEPELVADVEQEGEDLEESSEETMTISEENDASDNAADSADLAVESLGADESNGEAGDVSAAKSLEIGENTLSGMKAGDEKWLKFTAPDDGLYIIKSKAETENKPDCSYYIGSKEVKTLLFSTFAELMRGNL